MFRRLLKAESGYSLVEVMASIILLAIAIIPMAGMFDMGLSSSTKGHNYDKARAVANLKMEEAKSLSFAQVRDSFPVGGSAPAVATGHLDSGGIPLNTLPPYNTPPLNTEYDRFDLRVEKQYMQTPSSSSNFAPCDPAACNPGPNLIRITVTVTWGSSNTYSTYGLVAL